MRWIGGGLDKRNLEQRRQGWYVVKYVAPSLVPFVRKKKLRKSLETREHRVALLKRPAALAELEAVIANAARTQGHDGLMQEALLVAASLKSPQVVSVYEHSDGTVEEMTASDFTEEIVHEFTRAARKAKHPDVPMLVKVALGEATPVVSFVEPWLAEKDIEERSKGEYRLAVSELVEWARHASKPAALETFDRRTAGAYVTALRARSMARATVNKRLSALSSLWNWLGTKGHVEANVWRGHGVGAVTRTEREQEPERPFSDDEMALLMAGPADVKLADLMKIGALSGMRLEEIAMLRVRDVDLRDRTLAVRNPKTPASRRAVPIHPEVLEIVTRRCEGREKDDFLMAELGPAPKPGRQRSMAVSKAFNRYRQAVGVHDARKGQRRSLVNFHSFRRYFITKAEQAGAAENIIKSVVGHKRAGVTFGTYSGGASLGQRRACVEAVQLP